MTERLLRQLWQFINQISKLAPKTNRMTALLHLIEPVVNIVIDHFLFFLNKKKKSTICLKVSRDTCTDWENTVISPPHAC